MVEGVIGRAAAALGKALQDSGNDEARFAFHCGEAGGIAASAAIFGIKALELCDDISDAYENSDWHFLKDILSELEARPADGEAGPHVRTRQGGIGWEELGAALDDALRALEESNALRHSLIIGFASGLMFDNPGPTYQTTRLASDLFRHPGGEQPESQRSMEERVAAALGLEYPEISIRDAILLGHSEGCRELIQWARARIAAGVRLSSPLFLSPEGAKRDYETHLRMMRWVQNFGLRTTRARDESVSIPNSMAINYALMMGAADPDEDTEHA